MKQMPKYILEEIECLRFNCKNLESKMKPSSEDGFKLLSLMKKLELKLRDRNVNKNLKNFLVERLPLLYLQIHKFV